MEASYLGVGGTFDFAIATHETIPTARIIHPHISYFRSLDAAFFEFWNMKIKIKQKNLVINTQVNFDVK